MTDPAFIHLDLHSEYSLQDGLIRIPALMERAAEMDMPAVALTDHGNLFALVKFYRAAQRAGIKPLVGAELLVADHRGSRDPARLILLCQDRQGYLNLCHLLSRGYLESDRRGIAVVDPAWFRGHSEGLIALSGGMDGDVGRLLLAAENERATRALRAWMELFPDRYYLQLSRIGREREGDHEQALLALATQAGCPVVATNAARFLHREDFDAHEVRVCIHQGRLLEDPRRPREYTDQQYLRSGAEMQALFADLPAALENSVEIAKRCNLELNLGEYTLPAFPIPQDQSAEDYLQAVAERDLQEKLDRHGLAPDTTPEDYRQRLLHELEVINGMGFPGYFLVVADFVRWARNNAIPVGPGRGSGAGSLVAWVLSITDLDPLRYDLLFERFLNPERVSMPDFDIDFCMDQRDRVIDYVAGKYGRDRVSQIITFGKMNARAVVRDVGRVLGNGYSFVDGIAKLIPGALDITLERALKQEPQLATRYREEEEVSAILDRAMALEGITRNAGKHAGGVVIAPGPLSEYSPLYCEPGGGGLVTHFDKDDVEAIGLVKFDFLGLRTLTLIDWAVQAINRRREQAGEAPLDIQTIPLDDADTFKLLCACHTTAVFQLESRGMKDLIRKLQPDSFEDIIALVALFRPGPLESGMVGDYIDRKHGKAPVRYLHPDLEPILDSTYGVILYQEQVMQIAQSLAGYTLGGADLLRRAMGKKKPEEMARQRSIFVAGAGERGIEERLANRIFDLMETFAGYGFNKSHSAAYALLAYQTAYLKAHYPAEFMAAVLSADMDDSDKIANLVDDCRAMGLVVDPPDVNVSEYRFSVSEGRIRFGLGAIKGVGRSAVEAIVEARQGCDGCDSLTGMCSEIDLQRVNRRTLEALIRAGALAGIEPNGAQLMAELESALRNAEQLQSDRASGQVGLFGEQSAAPPQPVAPAPVAPWPEAQRLRAERETLGLYLTGHPMDAFRDELAQFVDARLGRLERLVPENGQARRGVVLAGLIMAVRRRAGRGAFVALDDGSGRMEVAVFEELFTQVADRLVRDEIVVVEGDVAVDDYSGGYRMVARQVRSLNEARERYAQLVRITLECGYDEVAEALQATLTPYRGGPALVRIHYRNQRASAELRLGEQWKVTPCDELLAALGDLEAVADVDFVYQREPERQPAETAA